MPDSIHYQTLDCIGLGMERFVLFPLLPPYHELMLLAGNQSALANTCVLFRVLWTSSRCQLMQRPHL
jgi:hypothetical protein